MPDSTTVHAVTRNISPTGPEKQGISWGWLLGLGLVIEAACLEIVRIGDLRTSLAAFMIGNRPVTILVLWLPFFAAFLVYLLAIQRVRNEEASHLPISPSPHPPIPPPNAECGTPKGSHGPKGHAMRNPESRRDRSVPARYLPRLAVSPKETSNAECGIKPHLPISSSPHPLISPAVLIILSLSVAFRITLIFSPPTLSDDIFRYVWDGRTQNYGVNPYQYPPNDGGVAGLRDEYYPGINNKHISTIYPPLMQMAFRVVDRIAHTPVAMKVFFTLCDLGIIAMILLLLRARALPYTRILIYAWNPLVLVEVAGSGHNDPLALGLMLAGIWAITGGKPKWSIFYLALSFTAKFFSVVLLPSLFRTLRRPGPFLVFPAVILLLYLPYLDAGAQLFHGLLVYGDKWRFNDSLFTLALEATGSLTQAKIIIGVLFAAVVLVRFMGDHPHLETAYVLVGAYLLLTPTLQPWYLIWIAPFLCFFPNRAWIMLTGLVIMAYHVLIQFTETGIWQESGWVRYAQFVPFYALLLYDAARNR